MNNNFNQENWMLVIWPLIHLQIPFWVFWAEIVSTVDDDLTKWPINHFKTVQQSRQHAYCTNIYIQKKIYIHIYQRPDQYKIKLLVFSIQYDFHILKYQYQYSIWRILNKYQYQYAKKTEVSVFSISILSGKKHEKTSKSSKSEKLKRT